MEWSTLLSQSKFSQKVLAFGFGCGRIQIEREMEMCEYVSFVASTEGSLEIYAAPDFDGHGEARAGWKIKDGGFWLQNVLAAFPIFKRTTCRELGVRRLEHMCGPFT